MIKTTIEQVSLVSEALKKAPGSTPPPSAPTPSNMDEARQANKKKLTEMFGKMNEHAVAGRSHEVNQIKGEIKNLALKAPKGSIDVGHLGMMRENHLPISGSRVRAFSKGDMEEIINHHLGDAKSLKDIHQNHGGDDTIRTLMHVMGANGSPRQYSNLKFNKPGVHEDLLDLIWEGKAQFDRDTQRHKGVMPRAYFTNTPVDPKLDDEVHRTGNSLWTEDEDDTLGVDRKHKFTAHENAVVARGLERFKRHHKLT
jgi:hypothetical protein